MIENLTATISKSRMHVFVSYPQPNPCDLRSRLHGQFEVYKHILVINSGCNRYLSAFYGEKEMILTNQDVGITSSQSVPNKFGYSGQLHPTVSFVLLYNRITTIILKVVFG